MDVSNTSFPSRLLEILEALSECDFVSIDFEFSGVSSKSSSSNRQSLQERYAETAAAATKYQILQVGLTCATYSDDKKSYVLKTWNIPLSPVVEHEKDFDLERQFSVQSGALSFLLSTGFDFNVSFEDGVRYLSREEEEHIKQNFKAGTAQVEDIEISPEDKLTGAFLEKVRGEVKEWLGIDNFKGQLCIYSRTQHWRDMVEMEGDLTSFDRRLIHQLLRKEFPMLRSFTRRQTIVIEYLNENKEHDFRKRKYLNLKQKIYEHTGFRWIIEAISKGPLDHIDLMWFARDPITGIARFCEPYAYTARFNRAKDKLKRRSPVLVGHNCFTDLIYLYSTFIGTLPATASEFRLRIHDLFPFVVDTKYLFTHNCGNMNPMSSLDGIEAALRVQSTPQIETHVEHPKYNDEEILHEAGYDSYLTARVMILLSAQLEAKGTYVVEKKAERPDLPMSPVTPERQDKKKNARPPSPDNEASRFATKTMFETLTDITNEENAEGGWDTETIIGNGITPPARSFFIPAADGASESASTRSGTPTRRRKNRESEGALQIDGIMPPFTSDFWRVYGNKLRVFGTTERLLDLDPVRQEHE